jgi:hypothetical protein
MGEPWAEGQEEMIRVDQKETLRREYFLNRKSMREIAKELHHGRTTIRKAIYGPGMPIDKRSAPADALLQPEAGRSPDPAREKPSGTVNLGLFPVTFPLCKLVRHSWPGLREGWSRKSGRACTPQFSIAAARRSGFYRAQCQFMELW